MKLIAEKYKSLKPTIEYLSDEVIIAQAWKKTHGYMRHHNWYADTLALDISALGLESNARNWAEEVKKKDLSLYPLILIPAAKSDQWVVDKQDGWSPKSFTDAETKEARKQKPPLRPLAHLRVRDQTWATAVMLCLADVVETAQGDCSEMIYLKAQNKGVYSYGNRLICDWNEDDEAWFRWGNSEVYRKFYTDYQNFLKRPVSLGRRIAGNQSDIDCVFIINLDLTKFYDHIDRNELINRLKELASSQKEYSECSIFWEQVKRITNWQWSDSSKEIAEKLELEIGGGLPQGLVASGFFSNAYLINFDKKRIRLFTQPLIRE